MKIRRTDFLFFYHTSTRIRDIKFSHFPPVLKDDQIYVISVLLGREIIIDKTDLDDLLQIPTDSWTDAGNYDVPVSRLTFYIDNGILLSDDVSHPKAVLLKRRDAVLTKEHWNLYAALYYNMSRWKGVDGGLPFFISMRQDPIDDVDHLLSQMKHPASTMPHHFHQLDTKNSAIPLPEPDGTNALLEILSRRKTTRNFDTTRALTIETLSCLLKDVFGYYGEQKTHQGYSLVKKNHPSGGSLHSIEVYVLSLNVQHLKTGIYHYQVHDHQLKPVKTYDPAEGRDLAIAIACHQKYAGDAAALFVLTSRFSRSFWKYREHPKMLSYHFREAAHMSQNFYLVCSAISLGAFTTSMNEIDADQEIGIDGFTEGSIMLLGCGHSVQKGHVNSFEEPKLGIEESEGRQAGHQTS